MHLFTAKPRITTPVSVLRTVPGHCVWFTAEGSPPVNVSIFKNEKLLTSGNRKVVKKINEKGNYTCLAANDVGSYTRNFAITFVGKINLGFNLVIVVIAVIGQQR